MSTATPENGGGIEPTQEHALVPVTFSPDSIETISQIKEAVTDYKILGLLLQTAHNRPLIQKTADDLKALATKQEATIFPFRKPAQFHIDWDSHAVRDLQKRYDEDRQNEPLAYSLRTVLQKLSKAFEETRLTVDATGQFLTFRFPQLPVHSETQRQWQEQVPIALSRSMLFGLMQQAEISQAASSGSSIERTQSERFLGVLAPLSPDIYRQLAYVMLHHTAETSKHLTAAATAWQETLEQTGLIPPGNTHVPIENRILPQIIAESLTAIANNPESPEAALHTIALRDAILQIHHRLGILLINEKKTPHLESLVKAVMEEPHLLDIAKQRLGFIVNKWEAGHHTLTRVATKRNEDS